MCEHYCRLQRSVFFAVLAPVLADRTGDPSAATCFFSHVVVHLPANEKEEFIC